MTTRREYRLLLAKAQPPGAPASPGLLLRTPAPADTEQLSTLMIDAYRGTIDDGGETLDDARGEVRSFFEQGANPPLLACSWVAQAGDELAAASLVAFWTERGCPLIAYAMARAAHKRRGFAGLLVGRCLDSLRAAGYAEVRAVITEGNLPSERLFARLGFARIS
ncbi:MAG TPA: GNAT family N-acetyltransferase [Roseiflexaceae bacterium]|nr:GNAT family N-acetyltransferase [Roseiflexaceae bacterium]